MSVLSKEYNACIYARLSRDDGDKLESDSIINQKALIRDFISKHPEIHVVSVKTGDGYSGVNFAGVREAVKYSVSMGMKPSR